MSYEIIYDKQFIKLTDDLYIPMVYSGSNNCYEWSGRGRGNGRRSRSWFAMTYELNGKSFGTAKEMLENVEAHRVKYFERYAKEDNITEEKFNKAFGYYTSIVVGSGHCSRTSFGMYKGIFVDGIKKARTIEELAEFGVYVRLYSSLYSKESEAKLKDAGIEEFSITPKSGEEFIREYNERKAAFESVGLAGSIYITLDADEMDMKRIRKAWKEANPSKKTKKEKFITEEYVIRYPNHGYFARGTRNGFRYTYYLCGQTLRIANKKAAERKLAKLSERYRDRGFVLETIQLQEPKRILV